ncbi:hypothetical protein GCM10009760_42060 [Kitasatospora kazusensis]|uniref:FXSXX-COOH protein n=1 Tax=Kitasatospora kazusensis TaxID=407974 RepID=A0ABN2ZWT1_9ACTN
MSQSAQQAAQSTIVPRPTANPRRTTLAAVADFGQLLGDRAPAKPVTYAAELPTNTANPRRTILMTAPAPRTPQD